MRMFIKCFLIVFVIVVIDSGLNKPPFNSEWLMGFCIIAALLASLIYRKLSFTIAAPALADEAIEFDIVEETE